MHTDRIAGLDDATLRRELSNAVSCERRATAALLAHLAEFDARRLYRAEACATLFAYCVEVLRYSESAALKRIQAARAARRFPRLLAELAEGRLHLSAVSVLAPHLTEENLDELVSAAVHRTRAEIEAWLVARFAPREGAPLPPARIRAVRVPAVQPESEAPLFTPGECASRDSHSPGNVDPQPAPLVRPVLEVPLDDETHALLREVQDLLGPAGGAGDLAAVIRRGLTALRAELLRRRAGAVARPRAPRVDAPTQGRHVPAHVRREVWARDGARCTFTSDDGRRCSATRGLEFDHAVPFARGGATTVEGLRLRCRAHNQLEAERAFGGEFMRRKRERERPSPDRDVESALRTLGCRAEEARRAAVHATELAASPLEERIRAALRFVGAGGRAAQVLQPA